MDNKLNSAAKPIRRYVHIAIDGDIATIMENDDPIDTLYTTVKTYQFCG